MSSRRLSRQHLLRLAGAIAVLLAAGAFLNHEHLQAHLLRGEDAADVATGTATDAADDTAAVTRS